jgi:hypothetical protein
MVNGGLDARQSARRSCKIKKRRRTEERRTQSAELPKWIPGFQVKPRWLGFPKPFTHNHPCGVCGIALRK